MEAILTGEPIPAERAYELGLVSRLTEPGEALDEALRLLESALTTLPVRQRTVVTLRDVQGLSSEEACDVLGITAQNQRVLLHRGRARLRQLLEDYHRPGVETAAR